MMRRLRELFQRAQSPQFRPNELRLDIARAERLRRESLRGDIRLTAGSEERPTRREPPIAAPVVDSLPASRVPGLRSRAGLRRAMLLKEILEPPLALRDAQRSDDRA
jgi:hypothetical protein